MSIESRLRKVEQQKMQAVKAEVEIYKQWVGTLSQKQAAEEWSKLAQEIDASIKLPGFCAWAVLQPEFEEHFEFDFDGSCFNRLVKHFGDLQKHELKKPTDTARTE